MILACLLVPALIAIGMLGSSSPARVALTLYLPILLWIPMYFQAHLGGFDLNATTIVALLTALGGYIAWQRKVRFAFIDLFMLLYLFGVFFSDANHGDPKLGMYVFLEALASCLFPYMIGRFLIEQPRLRAEFATTFVLCVGLVGIVSVVEYGIAYNIFQTLAQKISHQWYGWIRQTRWGFGRIAGPYGHAIIAGMVFSVGLLFQLWLVASKSWAPPTGKLRMLRSSRMPVYVTGAVVLGLFMTQSRGPWIGCAFGLIVASIGFARNRRRAAIFAISGFVVAVLATGIILNKYTDTSNRTSDEDQRNAEYRRNLIPLYLPLIEKGGLWGWGTPTLVNHGVLSWIAGHDSVDNEYIDLAMTQGYFGVSLLVLMLAFAMVNLIRKCITFQSRDDIIFAYCMLGSVISVAFTISTVFLGEPMVEILFLLLGWSQSVIPTRVLESATAPERAQPFVFERVFV